MSHYIGVFVAKLPANNSFMNPIYQVPAVDAEHNLYKDLCFRLMIVAIGGDNFYTDHLVHCTHDMNFFELHTLIFE